MTKPSESAPEDGAKNGAQNGAKNAAIGSSGNRGHKGAAQTAKSTDPVELVDHVQVDCEALLGSGQMTIGQLSKLAKGDVVTLDRSPADPVDIRVNGKTIARGEIVTVDDRFAIRLTEIG